MPITGFSIGKDTSLVVMHPEFGAMGFALLTNFMAKPVTNRLTSVPITNGGKPTHRQIYQGYEGSFEVDRSDALVDTLFQNLEDNHYAGKPETYFMINQTITNPDGSVSEFRFLNCVLALEDSGSWKADEKVTQRFTFAASHREQV